MAISVADPVTRDIRPGGRSIAFLLLDGLRRSRPAKSQDVALCALGLDRHGNPRPLALRVVAREGEQAWTALLRSLKASGVDHDLLLISCDGHPALVRAIHTAFPGTPVQISIAHRLLSLALKVDPEWRAACLAGARAIFAAPDLDTAVARFREWRTNWLKVGCRAVSSLESDLASCLSFYRFPQAMWPKIRTVNLVERVFREARQAVFSPSENPEPFDDEPAVLEIGSRNGTAPSSPEALPAGQTAVHAGTVAVAPSAGAPALPLQEVDLTGSAEAHVNGRAAPAPNGDRPAALVHVRDLSADADFMWWLARRRQHTDVRQHELTLAAMAVLTGLVVGLALMWVL